MRTQLYRVKKIGKVRLPDDKELRVVINNRYVNRVHAVDIILKPIQEGMTVKLFEVHTDIEDEPMTADALTGILNKLYGSDNIAVSEVRGWVYKVSGLH